MPNANGKKKETGAPDRLIEAAEVLFGKHGLDGVSMRQIQIASGSGNNFAVQYHFGGADGLISAILASRMPDVDLRQQEMLDRADADGLGQDVRALLAAFHKPLLEQVNSAGERSYARFIVALMASPDGVRHCRALLDLTPATTRILERLQAATPHLSHRMLMERMRLVSNMICSSVFNRLGEFDDADEALIDDVLDMAAPALAAPCRLPVARRRIAPRRKTA